MHPAEYALIHWHLLFFGFGTAIAYYLSYQGQLPALSFMQVVSTESLVLCPTPLRVQFLSICRTFSLIAFLYVQEATATGRARF